MTKIERKHHIMGKLRSAMGAIQNDPKYDWAREPSEAICTAAETMMKAVQKYIDGKLDEEAIRPLYKAYVQLHVR